MDENYIELEVVQKIDSIARCPIHFLCGDLPFYLGVYIVSISHQVLCD